MAAHRVWVLVSDVGGSLRGLEDWRGVGSLTDFGS